MKHIWNLGHGSPIYLSLTQSDSPSLKLFSGINFKIVHNCDRKCRLIVVFQILNIIIFTVAIVACFCIIDIAAMKHMCVNIDCSFNMRGIFKGRV